MEEKKTTFKKTGIQTKAREEFIEAVSKKTRRDPDYKLRKLINLNPIFNQRYQYRDYIKWMDI